MFTFQLTQFRLLNALKVLTQCLCLSCVFVASLQAVVFNFDLSQVTDGQTAHTLSLDGGNLTLDIATNSDWDGDVDSNKFPFTAPNNSNPGFAVNFYGPNEGLTIFPIDEASLNIPMTMTFRFNQDVTILGYVFGSIAGGTASVSLANNTQNLTMNEPSIDYTGDPTADFFGFSSEINMKAGEILTLTATKTQTFGWAGNLSWSSLRVETIPEPSTYALLAGLGASILCLRRFLMP